MLTLPVIFKRIHHAHQQQRNGTFSDEIAIIVAAVLVQIIEEAWTQSIYLRHKAAWAIDALASLSRLNTRLYDIVFNEHTALTHRLRVNEHGLARSRELLHPVNTLFELNSSCGGRCYSCATRHAPILKDFTLLRDRDTSSEVGIAICESCFNMHTGREDSGPYDHQSYKSVESHSTIRVATGFGILQSTDCVIVSLARKLPRKSAGVIVLSESGLIEAEREVRANAHRRDSIESNLVAHAKIADAAIVAGLDKRETIRLHSMILDERTDVLFNVIRLLGNPVEAPSLRMRRVIKFVAIVIHRFPKALWSERHGSALVNRLLDETHWTRPVRDVIEQPHLVESALDAPTARFDIVSAHVWVAPWQHLYAPQYAARPTKYAIVFDVEVTPCVRRASPIRLVLTSADLLDAFGIRNPRHQRFGVISHEWMAEMQIRHRMLDEMRSPKEEQARITQRKLLSQRVTEMENEQVGFAFDVLSSRLKRARFEQETLIILQSRMWQLAQRTLTRDVMWRIALSTRPTHRVSTAHRVPLRGALPLLTGCEVDT